MKTLKPYYDRDIERWVCAVRNSNNDTLYLAIGFTSELARERAELIYKLLANIDCLS